MKKFLVGIMILGSFSAFAEKRSHPLVRVFVKKGPGVGQVVGEPLAGINPQEICVYVGDAAALNRTGELEIFMEGYGIADWRYHDSILVHKTTITHLSYPLKNYCVVIPKMARQDLMYFKAKLNIEGNVDVSARYCAPMSNNYSSKPGKWSVSRFRALNYITGNE